MSKVLIIDNIPDTHVGGMTTYKKQFISGLKSANVDYCINDKEESINCNQVVILSHMHDFDRELLNKDHKIYVIVHSIEDMMDKGTPVFSNIISKNENQVNLVLYRSSYNTRELNSFLLTKTYIKKFNIIINRMMHSTPNFNLPSNSTEFNLVWLGRLVDVHNLYSRLVVTKNFNFTMFFSSDSIYESDIEFIKDAKNITCFIDKSHEFIQSELSDYRVGIVPASYSDNGFPLTHVINEMIMSGVIPLVPKSVAERIHKEDPYLILPAFEDGWRFQPIKDLQEVFYNIMDNETLDYIAKVNYDRMLYKYKPEYNVKHILGV